MSNAVGYKYATKYINEMLNNGNWILLKQFNHRVLKIKTGNGLVRTITTKEAFKAH